MLDNLSLKFDNHTQKFRQMSIIMKLDAYNTESLKLGSKFIRIVIVYQNSHNM